MWFRSRLKLGIIIFTILITLLLISCGGGGIGGNPAVDVVERYYEAFSADDMDALMDTVEPDDRNKTGMGLVSLLDSLSFSLGGIGIDAGSLTSYSVSNMEFDVVSEADDYALVRAEGDFRNSAMGIEVPLCDLHDVRRDSDGNWYIDIDAAERTQRMARIQAAQQERLMELLNSGATSGDMFADMAQTISIFTNMCE